MLLDLDAEDRKPVSPLEEYTKIWEQPTFITEQHIMAALIFRYQTIRYYKHDSLAADILINSFEPIRKHSYDSFRYNPYRLHPNVCAGCFTFFGETIGGDLRFACVYCFTQVIPIRERTLLLGQATHFFPLGCPEQARILAAYTLQKYFKLRKAVECTNL